jgi:hypothetical protein
METFQKKQMDHQDIMMKAQDLHYQAMEKDIVKEIKTQHDEYGVLRGKDSLFVEAIIIQVKQSRGEIRRLQTDLEGKSKTLSNQDARISQVMNEARLWQKEPKELLQEWRESREVAWKDPLAFQYIKEGYRNHGVVGESILRDSETDSVTRRDVRKLTVRREERVEDSRNGNSSKTQEDEIRPRLQDGRTQEPISGTHGGRSGKTRGLVDHWAGERRRGSFISLARKVDGREYKYSNDTTVRQGRRMTTKRSNGDEGYIDGRDEKRHSSSREEQSCRKDCRYSGETGRLASMESGYRPRDITRDGRREREALLPDGITQEQLPLIVDEA